MKTQEKEIPLFLNINNIPLKRKALLPISALSTYGNNVWDFNIEIPNKNRKDSEKKIRWNNIIFDDGTKFTNPKHAKLLESAKDFLFSLMSHPVNNKTPKHITIIIYFWSLKSLIKWMVKKGYWQFSQLDKYGCNNYLSYLNSIPISKSSRAQCLDILIKLYQQKEKIDDAIVVHPFEYESANSMAGYNHTEMIKNKWKHIPEEVTTDILGKALIFIENKSTSLLKLQDTIEDMEGKWQEAHKHTWYIKVNTTKYLREKGWSGKSKFTKELRLLRTACYIIIAFCSGMRDSEILSIEEGCVKKVKSKSGQWIYKIFSIIYKTVNQPRADNWMVPPLVKTAVDVLRRLTAPLRTEAGLKELFLCNSIKKGIHVLSNGAINRDLKEFVKLTGVALYKDKKWRLHAHQFRHSFAYYMMKENRCNLKFLQMQFKHLSMDMTIWYAETNDEELKRDIYEMSVEVNREILKPILLGSDTLAGKGGEQIMKKRDAYFSGKTDKEKESLFEEIIKDLYVRGIYLGLCIWNPEKAECNAGFECSCNPNICKNAVVTSEHLPIWIRLKERHEKLLSLTNIEPLKKQYIQNQLDTFVIPILKKLKYNESSLKEG